MLPLKISNRRTLLRYLIYYALHENEKASSVFWRVFLKRAGSENTYKGYLFSMSTFSVKMLYRRVSGWTSGQTLPV